MAQKNMIEIATMFHENANWGDITLLGGDNVALKLDYYLKDGLLYKKENDVLKSIALKDIDFSREFIYENAVDVVSYSKKNPYDMSIYSLKPKKIPGFNLSFEYKEEAEVAFTYLKMKAQNPNNELILTSNFSTQLEQIICSASSNFDSIKGGYYSKMHTFSNKSKVQLEGSLDTEIANETVSIQFGDFENEAAAVKAYNLLREKINSTAFTCCKVSTQMFSEYKPEKKIGMGLWNIQGLKGLENKSVMLQITLFNTSLELKVLIMSQEDDDW